MPVYCMLCVGFFSLMEQDLATLKQLQKKVENMSALQEVFQAFRKIQFPQQKRDNN